MMDIDIVNWTPARMGWTGLDIKPVWRGLGWAVLGWLGWSLPPPPRRELRHRTIADPGTFGGEHGYL